MSSLPPAQIDPTSIIDPGAQIGAGTVVWHFCHLMSSSVVGERCHIGQNVVIQPHVVIGDGCRILNNVTIYTGVECEEEVFLGPSCVFTNVINPRAAVSRKHEFRPTYVRRGASIGANATILCGIEIGAYALVGAGSVVTHSVPPYAVVVGNPARQTGWVSRAGYPLDFSQSNPYPVEQEGISYRLDLETSSVEPLS